MGCWRIQARRILHCNPWRVCWVETHFAFGALEAVVFSDRVVSGPTLPVTPSGPCVTVINQTHSFLCGGDYYQLGIASDAWIYNWLTDQWVRIPGMRERRYMAFCLTFGEGNKIMVLGGSGPFTIIIRVRWPLLPISTNGGLDHLKWHLFSKKNLCWLIIHQRQSPRPRPKSSA